MSVDEVRYRVATPEDQAFLDDMNVSASFWNKTTEGVLSSEDVFDVYPRIAEFSEGFGRLGDLGLIATDADDQPVGAIWGRDYERTADDGAMQDYPFEITMAVREAARKQGIGRQLLDSFAVMAWLHGKDDVGLGVHFENPARSLYEAAGYTPILDKNSNETRVDKIYVPMMRGLDFVPVLRVTTNYHSTRSSEATVLLRGSNPTRKNNVSTTTYHVFRGHGTMTVGSKVYVLEPGEAVEVPAGTPYSDEGNVDMEAISMPPFKEADVEIVG